MVSDKSRNKTRSLTDIWRVLTEFKTNLEKLMLDMESLNGNCRELVCKTPIVRNSRGAIVYLNFTLKIPKTSWDAYGKVLKRGMKVF